MLIKLVSQVQSIASAKVIWPMKQQEHSRDWRGVGEHSEFQANAHGWLAQGCGARRHQALHPSHGRRNDGLVPRLAYGLVQHTLHVSLVLLKPCVIEALLN